MKELLRSLLEDGDACPACGEPINTPREVAGYDELHCLECGQAIERRRGWLDGRAGAA